MVSSIRSKDFVMPSAIGRFSANHRFRSDTPLTHRPKEKQNTYESRLDGHRTGCDPPNQPMKRRTRVWVFPFFLVLSFGRTTKRRFFFSSSSFFFVFVFFCFRRWDATPVPSDGWRTIADRTPGCRAFYSGPRRNRRRSSATSRAVVTETR